MALVMFILFLVYSTYSEVLIAGDLCVLMYYDHETEDVFLKDRLIG